MHTFLNNPLLSINHTKPIFHHIFVQFQLLKMSEHDEHAHDHRINHGVISNLKMRYYFMNFRYIEHYGASVGDDFYAKMK